MTNVVFLSAIVGAGVSLIVSVLINWRRENRNSTGVISSARSPEAEIWE